MPDKINPLTKGLQVATEMGTQIEARGRQVTSSGMSLTSSSAEPAPPQPMGSKNVNNDNNK